MRILGVDPGIAKAGCGVIDEEAGRRPSLVGFSSIHTSSTDPIATRLLKIHDAFQKLIEELRPEVCVVETLFFARNASSAFMVGQARGVFVLVAARAGLEVVEYTPLQVKKAVAGYGKASKDQVQYMVKNLLGLKDAPESPDAADALALALCHGQMKKLAGLGVVVGSRRKRSYRGYKDFKPAGKPAPEGGPGGGPGSGT